MGPTKTHTHTCKPRAYNIYLCVVCHNKLKKKHQTIVQFFNEKLCLFMKNNGWGTIRKRQMNYEYKQNSEMFRFSNRVFNVNIA